MKSCVTLKANGVGQGVLTVDGVDISKTVNSVDVQVSAGGASVVAIGLTATSLEDIRIDDAEISIREVAMPLSVELALYAHLASKHGNPTIETTSICDKIRTHSVKSA